MTTNNQLDQLIHSFADALNPPDELTLTEWADRYRILPGVSSSEEGPWRTSRFPFLKEIMNELSPDNPRQQIVVIKGAQLGFTEIALNWMLYTVDHNPAPMMYVQKTIDTVERFSKQRLQPSIEVCPRIAAKMMPERVSTGMRGRPGRSSSDTVRMKSFPGGIIILGGANSAASLRSAPIQDLILDEEDSYELDIEEEGSPSDIAIRRTANFPNRKILRMSSPTVKEISKIEAAFEEGDQRRYYVPCPHCKEKQVIYWRHIKWDTNQREEPTNVRMICEHCKQEIPERFKTWMLENGEWIAAQPGRATASFHLSSLYTPLGFYSWHDAAMDFVKATRNFDKASLKVFVNTVLGETWNESNRSIESAGIARRKEIYAAEVPMQAKVLTAGVDVQDDRVEVEVVGFGSGQESWSIEYATFMGNTELSFVWDQLDMFLQKTWLHESGTRVNLAVTAVDSGHRARLVYNFCKLREFRRIFPVKGKYGWGQGLIHRPKYRNDDGVYLFTLYVDEIKSKIYSQLMVEGPGPGFSHFPQRPEYDDDYFKMLTAERLITKRAHGQRSLQWELPSGRRNEALDCRSYAIAALNILNPNFDLLDTMSTPLVARNRRTAVRRSGRILSQGL
jgi:phage terminase large subunit GpA-like protein